MHVQHTEGPLDGSLYARVTKSRKELQEEHLQQELQQHHEQLLKQQQQHHLQEYPYQYPQPSGRVTDVSDGRVDLSMESGISSTSGYNSTMKSQTMSSAGDTSSLSRALQTKSPSDEGQLDEILSELLNDDLFVNSPVSTLTRDGAVTPSSGSLTTHSGNSRTVISWTTSQAGPTKSAMVTQKTVAKPSPNSHMESVAMQKREVSSFGNPMNGDASDGYTYGSSSVKETKKSETFSTSETRENIGSPLSFSPFGSPIPPPRSRLHSLPYKIDYENRSQDSFSLGSLDYSSDSEQLSWLAQQQMKLQAKKGGSNKQYSQRTDEEKRLVAELKNAQDHYKTKKAQNEAEEEEILAQYTSTHQSMYTNGPSTFPRSPSPEKPPPSYKSLSPDHFKSASAERYATLSPEPTSRNRVMSPEHFRFRTTSPKPLRRTHSYQDPSSDYKTEKSFWVSGLERPAYTTQETKYTFSVSPPKSSSISSTEVSSMSIRSKPPPSPGPVRSSAPTSPIIPQRSSSREVVKTQKVSSKPPRTPPPTEPVQSYSYQQSSSTYQSSTSTTTVHEKSSPDGIIEESIQRKAIQPKSAAYSPRLDELERSLQAALKSAPSQDEQPEEVEEEVVSLQPIGVGMQNLEPNTPGTRSRPITPSFPVSGPSPGVSPGAQVPMMTRHHQQMHQSQEYHSMTQGGFPGESPVPPPQAMSTPQPMLPAGMQPVTGRALSPSQQQQEYSTLQQPRGPAQDIPIEVLPHQQMGASQHAEQQYFMQQQQGSAQSAPYPGTGPTGTLTRDGTLTSQGSMGTISQNGYASHSGTLQSQSGTLRAQQAGTAMVHHQYSSAPADKPGLVNASVQITSLGPDETIGIEGAGTKGYSSTTERTGSHAVQGSLQGSGRQGYSHTFERGQTASSGYQGAGQQGYAHTIERSQSVQGAPLSGQQNFAHTIERSHSVQGAPLSTIQQPMTQHSYQTSEQSAHSSRSAHEMQGGHMGVTSVGGSAGQQLGQVEYQHGHVQDQMSMHGTGQHQQSYSQVQAQHMASHKGAVQSHHDGMQNGTMETLTVDTSHRGFSAGLPRSPSSGGSQAYSPSSLGSANMLQRRHAESGALTPGASSMTGERSPYLGHSRSTSFSSIGDGNDTLTHGTPRFVRDTSKFWYKPHISRDEAISLLKDKPAGTFVVRDSNSFPGAFGLALKVAHVPPNVQMKPGDQPGSELVRHFLIEPTPKGVKLKGCSNEPVFGSLAALVYQHSITPLALPCKLLLPEAGRYMQIDPADLDSPDGKVKEVPSSPSQLLSQGAACNVLYINSIDTESLTGPEAVAKAVKETFAMNPPPKDTVVHFKVNLQGLTLTDNKRRLFFRRHYPINTVTFCGMDAEDRRWSKKTPESGLPLNAKMFGFVARKPGSNTDNACHLFAELDPEQPAQAIVNFVTKVMIGAGRAPKS